MKVESQMLNVEFAEKMRSLDDPETRVPTIGTRGTLRLFLICELTASYLVRSTEVSTEEPIITAPPKVEAFSDFSNSVGYTCEVYCGGPQQGKIMNFRQVMLGLLWACVLLFSNSCQAREIVKSKYIRKADKDSVIVFVHGVLGDAQATWTNTGTKAFWPELIKKDPFFNGYDIYLYSYSSPFLGVSYTIDELVEDMRRELDNSDVFGSHKRVIFLCHSMGGLIVRAFLTRFQQLASQVPMIYFYSTPTTGAEVASLGRLLSSNPQLRGMLPFGSGNDYLASIQKNWLAANFSIASYCAYETQDTNGIRIVAMESATNLCNRRVDPINANHVDIVKPRDSDDTAYISFRNAIKEVQRDAKHPGLPSHPTSKSPDGERPNKVSPIDGLSRLGWTIQPGAGEDQFEIAYKPLPPMQESAAYFARLNKPFRLHFQGVKDIEGLHYLASVSGCRKIEINAGEFADISGLRGFRNLSALVIGQTPLNGLGLVDISPLSSLTNLRELSLSDTKARSIEALARLTKLRRLDLGLTLADDLSPVAGFASLEYLDIRGTRISDLTALNHLENLQELQIGGVQVPGLVSLANLKKLKRLTIIEQAGVDLAPVGTLTNLEYLWIWGPSRLNAAPLRNLEKLQELSIMGFSFGSVSVVTDISTLGNLKDLKKLTLAGILVADLTFVASLKNLTELNVRSLPITSIAFLRGLTSLRSVSFNQIPVTDFSPLLELPALSSLAVFNTPAGVDVLTELERRGVKITR